SPATAAVGLVLDVVPGHELRLRRAIDAVPHGAEFVLVRSRAAVAERDVAVGRAPEQPDARATGKGLAQALVNLADGFLDVRKSVVPVLYRALTESVRQ